MSNLHFGYFLFSNLLLGYNKFIYWNVRESSFFLGEGLWRIC